MQFITNKNKRTRKFCKTMDIRDTHTLKEENKLILQNENVAYTKKTKTLTQSTKLMELVNVKNTSKHVNIVN
jgi:hypothetical protein